MIYGRVQALLHLYKTEEIYEDTMKMQGKWNACFDDKYGTKEIYFNDLHFSLVTYGQTCKL